MGRAALCQLLTFGALLGAWEILARTEVWDAMLFSSPSEIGAYLWTSLCDGTLVAAMLITVRRLAIGFSIGVLIGVPAGFLIAYSPFVRSTVGILALGLQALPSVCWIPLALLWFGQTEGAVLFVVVMGTLWSIAISVGDGIRTIPPIFVRAARTMGARSFTMITKVIFPAALPVVLMGMKQGWAFAWRSLLAAEIFVTILSGFGLGHLLHYGRELHAMDQVFGIMFVILAIGLVTDLLLFGSLQRVINKRWGIASA